MRMTSVSKYCSVVTFSQFLKMQSDVLLEEKEQLNASQLKHDALLQAEGGQNFSVQL